jgi:hypothetical protein
VNPFAFDEPDRPSRRRRDDDYDDVPRRRRRQDEDDDYDDCQDVDEVRRRLESIHTIAVLSCVLCWIPLIGIILGIIAYAQASGFTSDPDQPGGISSRVRARATQNLAVTGITLSVTLILLFVIINCGFGGFRF